MRTMQMRVPTINALTSLQRELNQAQSKGRQVILAGGEPDRKAAAQQIFVSNWDDIGKDVAKLDELSVHWSLQANRDRLTEIKGQLPALREAQETAMKHATGSDRDAIAKAGNEFSDKATVSTEVIKQALDGVSESNQKLLQAETEGMIAANRSMNLTIGGNRPRRGVHRSCCGLFHHPRHYCCSQAREISR